MAKKGLGKGLDLLIPKTTPDKHINSITETKVPERMSEPEVQHTPEPVVRSMPVPPSDSSSTDNQAEQIVSLKISLVEPNRDQARKNFDDAALDELSQSIRRYGVIQPIVVCKKEDYYEIIAGERRWRAARKAGLIEIPVVIRDYKETEKAEISLIENIQRENLNPIEEAAAYKQLIDEYHLTQENLAERLSKSRTAIANTLRLLKLDEKVQQMVIDGKISGGHARALLAIPGAADQIKAANKIIDNNLNVRQTEEMVKELIKTEEAPARKRNNKKAAADKMYKDLENRMTDVLGTKVRIHQKEKGGGKIEILYFSDDDLDRIYTNINSIKN